MKFQYMQYKTSTNDPHTLVMRAVFYTLIIRIRMLVESSSNSTISKNGMCQKFDKS